MGVQGQALLLPACEECLLRIPGQAHHRTPRRVEAPTVGPDQVDVCKGSPCRYRHCNLTGKELDHPLAAHLVTAVIAHFCRAKA